MGQQALRFLDFELDPGGFNLRRSGLRIHLERKPMELLILLAQKNGQLVSREEIVERLWGQGFHFDAERGINNAIRKIRSSLNDDADEPRIVETVVGKGYRLIAPVERVLQPPPTPAHGPVPLSDAGLPRRRRRLAWIATLAAAVVTSAVVFDFSEIRNGILARRAHPIRSIVVLPLENLSGDAAQEYLADGMTAELITDLSKIGPLRVISRTSVMRFKGTHQPLAEIARRLNVDAVVEGGVLCSSDRVRITAQLIEARSDRILWAETYDGDVQGILALESAVAAAITRQVETHVTPADAAKLSPVRQPDPDAYQLYLQGLYYSARGSVPSASRSREYFQKAVAKDPGYARAWVGLAFACNVMSDYVRGKESALKALALDDTLGEGHAALAFATWRNDWDWRVAEQEFKRAIELDPNIANAHHMYALYLADLRRDAESRAQLERTLELDPLSPLAHTNLGSISLASHDFNRAFRELKKALEIDPSFCDAHENLGWLYETMGKYDQALAEYEKYRTLGGNPLVTKADVAHLDAVQGRRADAQKLLEEMKAGHKPGDELSYDVALVYVGLGDKDNAFKWFEIAYKEHFEDMLDLNDDQRTEPLRSDPRFQDLVRRLGFPANKAEGPPRRELRPGSY